MNGLLLHSQRQNKDIKLNIKNRQDLEVNKEENSDDFFQDLMTTLLHDLPNDKNKNFLIAKLLDLPQDFEKKEEITSSFSQEKLFTRHNLQEVSIEELLQVATFLKNSPNSPIDFPTNSQALKTSLLDLNVQKAFKNAKTINDLFKIAKDNGIEIKNFDFFKEDAILDPQTKSMVKQIKSEDIFKILEKQIQTPHQLERKNKVLPSNILKDVLSNHTTHKSISTERIDVFHIKETSNSQKNITPVLDDKITVKTPVHNHQKIGVLHTHKDLKSQKIVIPKIDEKIAVKTSVHSHKDIKMHNTQPKTMINTAQIESVNYNIKTHDILSEKLNTISHEKENFMHSKSTPLLAQSMRVKDHKKTLSLSIDKKELDKQDKTTANSLTTQKISTSKTDTNQLSQLLKQTPNAQSNIEIKEQNSKQITIEKVDSKLAQESTQEENTHTISTHETKAHTIQATKQHETPELKKTFHTFVQDFKEKVENYKPPLMKIKMQLNPGNLGDVDVTLINRGNNLHVSINSNPNTIALFVQNQAEFKNSLVNMGFTGLQMNFGENKDGQRGQNHKDNNKNNHNHEDDIQEQDGFEMVVPRYI